MTDLLTTIGNSLADAPDGFADLASQIRGLAKSDTPLRLAVAGPYTAGKSTLITALTGAEIEVGMAPVTGGVETYPFGDIELVDMPGTISGQMEHDEIARKSIAGADLLLFVISNELFSEESLPYFKHAAEDLHKSDQMLLVVNKFDRFNRAGRSESEAVTFIGAALTEIIAPLEISSFGPHVVSAKKYLAGIKIDDVVKRNQKIDSSRVLLLIDAIDKFTSERGLLGREVAPLQQALLILEEAKKRSFGDDTKSQNVDQLIRRNRFALTEGRAYGRTELIRLREDVRSAALKPIEPMLRAVEEKSNEAALNQLWIEANREIDQTVRDAGAHLEELIGKLRIDLEDRLGEVSSSPLARNIAEQFDLSHEEITFAGLDERGTGKVQIAAVKLMKAQAPKLVKNSKKAAEHVGKFYKFFGGKFKPWGKVKLGKYLGKVGKVMGPLAVFLETYMEYADDKKKDTAEARLREIRTEVRAQFNSLATQVCDQFDEIATDVVVTLYTSALQDIDRQASEVSLRADEEADMMRHIEGLEQQCRRVIEQASW